LNDKQNSYPPKLAALLAELSEVTDRDERSDMLIELASKFRGIPAEVAVRPYPEAHRVPGCESEAFIFTQKSPDRSIRYFIGVENPQGISAKALAAIIDETLSGSKPEEIQSVNESIVHEIFGNTVSMGKGQGLMGMVRMAKALAR
jgi:cysteine desulfuration protein SufE